MDKAIYHMNDNMGIQSSEVTGSGHDHLLVCPQCTGQYEAGGQHCPHCGAANALHRPLPDNAHARYALKFAIIFAVAYQIIIGFCRAFDFPILGFISSLVALRLSHRVLRQAKLGKNLAQEQNTYGSGMCLAASIIGNILMFISILFGVIFGISSLGSILLFFRRVF